MFLGPVSDRGGAPIVLVFFIALNILFAQPASEPLDLITYGRIREEGNAHSRAMDYATELMDGIGPRLTGSPNLKKAIAWARDRLSGMGCSNVRQESWGEFGIGWRQRNVWVRMTEPDTATFIAQAAPWSPATPGTVAGEVVAVRGFVEEKEFEPHRGKLAGKIVLLGTAPSAPEVFPIDKPLFERLDDRLLAEFARYPLGGPDTGQERFEKAFARFELLEKAGRFLAAEKVAAVIVPSGNNAKGGASGGTIYADTNYTFGWYVYRREQALQVPLVIVAIEHYGRVSRLLERNAPVRIELNIDSEFTGDHEEAFNVFADIAGVDPKRKDEVVIGRGAPG